MDTTIFIWRLLFFSFTFLPPFHQAWPCHNLKYIEQFLLCNSTLKDTLIQKPHCDPELWHNIKCQSTCILSFYVGVLLVFRRVRVYSPVPVLWTLLLSCSASLKKKSFCAVKTIKTICLVYLIIWPLYMLCYWVHSC